MSFRRFATVAALTIAGLLAAVGIGLLANSISGDNVGLSAKPLSAGETLAPSTADRAKAMGVAMAGLAPDAEVEVADLELSTRMAATVLGFHPEHVRRLIRGGRVRARRVGGDYRIRVDDLWPLLEARSRPRDPGRGR